MSEPAATAEDVRAHILNAPDLILEDADVMRALIAANDRAVGANIVDLRGIAMERLESRLERLEETHKSVIAAAYENLAGMSQVHRAILAFLEPLDFDTFLDRLGRDVADILRVPSVRLVLESHEAAQPNVDSAQPLTILPAGAILGYFGHANLERRVALKAPPPDAVTIYGAAAENIRSEALILLDFGEGRLPGLLAFGSPDADHFVASQGTDLLLFMGQVFERAMRRWLD